MQPVERARRDLELAGDTTPAGAEGSILVDLVIVVGEEAGIAVAGRIAPFPAELEGCWYEAAKGRGGGEHTRIVASLRLRRGSTLEAGHFC